MDFWRNSWVLNETLAYCVRMLQLHKLVDGELAILEEKLTVGPVVSSVVRCGNEREMNPCVWVTLEQRMVF